jgi:hypothetical protein
MTTPERSDHAFDADDRIVPIEDTAGSNRRKESGPLKPALASKRPHPRLDVAASRQQRENEPRVHDFCQVIGFIVSAARIVETWINRRLPSGSAIAINSPFASASST